MTDKFYYLGVDSINRDVSGRDYAHDYGSGDGTGSGYEHGSGSGTWKEASHYESPRSILLLYEVLPIISYFL